jgi:D-glycero-D-manno-heptose 1,7-bisphosphate phosphatase
MAIFPDAAAATRELHRHGFRLVLVTNQPDVARGRISRATVEAMNARVRASVPLDAIEVCLHDDSDNCNCRKPKPGMLLRAAKRDGIALEESFMIGDRYRDIEAGRSAGCRTILIGDGYSEKFNVQPDATCANLTAAVSWILKQPARREET